MSIVSSNFPFAPALTAATACATLSVAPPDGTAVSSVATAPSTQHDPAGGGGDPLGSAKDTRRDAIASAPAPASGAVAVAARVASVLNARRYASAAGAARGASGAAQLRSPRRNAIARAQKTYGASADALVSKLQERRDRIETPRNETNDITTWRCGTKKNTSLGRRALLIGATNANPSLPEGDALALRSDATRFRRFPPDRPRNSALLPYPRAARSNAALLRGDGFRIAARADAASRRVRAPPATRASASSAAAAGSRARPLGSRSRTAGVPAPRRRTRCRC